MIFILFKKKWVLRWSWLTEILGRLFWYHCIWFLIKRWSMIFTWKFKGIEIFTRLAAINVCIWYVLFHVRFQLRLKWTRIQSLKIRFIRLRWKTCDLISFAYILRILDEKFIMHLLHSFDTPFVVITYFLDVIAILDLLLNNSLLS